MSEARHPNAPIWYQEALDIPRTDETITVDGCPVHYLAWGERGRRGLVFVHGGGAHAHWWTHVAARYAARYRVAAIDLSGHGDSGSRERYSLEGWTNEVLAVADDPHRLVQAVAADATRLPPVLLDLPRRQLDTVVGVAELGGHDAAHRAAGEGVADEHGRAAAVREGRVPAARRGGRPQATRLATCRGAVGRGQGHHWHRMALISGSKIEVPVRLDDAPLSAE